jgi:acetylornithine deacetylase/succinyl-diaminopimelate desuccinylase-like protein
MATQTDQIESSLRALLASPAVAKMLDDIEADAGRTVSEQKAIAEMPAPPFQERVRAQYYRARFIELGLEQAAIDAEGNVIALRRGNGGGPKVVVSAHLDTVFPEGTDVRVKEADGVLRGPGIGDNARGLAVLLSLLRTIDANTARTVGDVMWVGTVGEEELGNLRGVKALFRDHQDIDGFISIDGLKIARVVNQATGSRRYEVIFRGPGGHSFSEFGVPSAIHAMGRAIARISELTTPSDPKTTFTVGTVRGGTSVNAIAGEARMAVDLRSTSPGELSRLEASVLAIVQEAVADENRRWSADSIAAETRLIGDRPAGMTAEDSPVIETVRRSLGAIMPEPRIVLAASSTDSNLAMSLGIPAVTIGGGGEGGGQHSLKEWYRPTEAHLGPQNALLTLLMLVGLDGVSTPVLARRAGK